MLQSPIATTRRITVVTPIVTFAAVTLPLSIRTLVSIEPSGPNQTARNESSTYYGYPDESILSFFEDLEGYFGIKRMIDNDERNALMHFRLKGPARKSNNPLS